MTTKTPTRPAQGGELSGEGAVAALRHAADGVRRVGELAGHAAAAAELVEALERAKGQCGADGTRALRTAWVAAARRSRAEYDVTTGPLRTLEQQTAAVASQQLMRAYGALDRITVGKLNEEGATP